MDNAIVFMPDRPVIMTHKGWKDYGRHQTTFKPLLNVGIHHDASPAPKIASKRKDKTVQQFQFINATTPRFSRDCKTQKTVRRHVRNDFLRQQEHDNKYNRNHNQPITPSTIQPPISHPTALTNSQYPIDMPPHTHALLSSYLTHAAQRMYPSTSLKSNPLHSPAWLHFAVTDAAMFHAMLYAGAVYMALLAGTHESRDSIFHQNQTVAIVQARLGEGLQIQDSTLGAISCLALGEVCFTVR
jgi:hypothetical protein